MDLALLVGRTYGQLKPCSVETNIPLPGDSFNDYVGQGSAHFRLSDHYFPNNSGHTGGEKEYHILSKVSPYIGPQGRFKVPESSIQCPRMPEPLSNLRPRKINK